MPKKKAHSHANLKQKNRSRIFQKELWQKKKKTEREKEEDFMTPESRHYKNQINQQKIKTPDRKSNNMPQN